MKQTEIIVIGGANGSGKTTFAREILLESDLKYLSADEIASTINNQNPENAAIEAARRFSQILYEDIEKGESLLIESTLSGISLKKYLVNAKANGFKISIYFIYLDSAELCINRIASRVARGGHFIPPEDVRRRFSRSNTNFWNIYKPLSEDWYLFRNAGDNFQQIAVGAEKDVIIFNDARYEEWLKMAIK